MNEAGTRKDRSLDLSASPSGRRCLVIQMHGEPGSGKSTLACALAPRIGAVALDKDVIKAALLRTGIAERDAAPAAYEAYFAQARALLAAGHSVILDNPVYWDSVERRWLDIAREVASPAILIECVCPDRDELVRRLGARDALESQPRQPLNLQRHPGAVETTYQPRLTLDTMRRLEDLVEEAQSYIEATLRLAPTPTTNDQRPATTRP